MTETFEDNAIGRFILAARAFSAEVEREKIVERTTRGKLQRAREGRIPQAMGKGTYGYIYNPLTGQREIEPFQAEVVRRVFQRYAETRSYSAVSNGLNGEKIPAFAGGRWYPLTIRRILMNESYTGRLMFRRTKWVASRTRNGKKVRRPVARPAEEHIEIPGASPAIIGVALFERVEAILNDPERAHRRVMPRFYLLRGRTRCSRCGSAMVGQTMSSKGRDYKYYVCRHTYDRRTGHECDNRHVRGDKLEAGVFQKIEEVLSDPTIVYEEWRRQGTTEVDEAEVARLDREVARIRDREKRLVRLYACGEFDEETIQEEGATLKQQRAALEARLDALRVIRPARTDIDREELGRICEAVAAWLRRATPEEPQLVLEALQINIFATSEEADLCGILPTVPPRFTSLDVHADARGTIGLNRTHVCNRPIVLPRRQNYASSGALCGCAFAT